MPLSVPPPRESRFGSPLELSPVHWVKPELVVEVAHLTWTAGGLLRHVSYRGARKRPLLDIVVADCRPVVTPRSTHKSNAAMQHYS